MQKITIGLSVHRSEMIPLIADWMQRHDAIFLEEPPTDGFEEMLARALAVDDYLSQLDMEFPAFSRDMCYLQRELHAGGKKIYQVEPYLEILLDIHAFFAEGHSPGELDKNSIQYPVYLAERNATGALLSYYQTVMIGSFEKTIESIKQFARMDAARFRLRDSLRAQALIHLVNKYPSSYIEAGVIHYPLWRMLKQLLPPQASVRLVFPAEAAMKTWHWSGHLYGPGDQLTLIYVFHPNISETRRQQELAARSIIYAKIIKKEELKGDRNHFPHIRDELSCIEKTRQLTLDDCRKLFPLVRQTKTSEARQIVADYLSGTKAEAQ